LYWIFAISAVSLAGSTCGLNDVNQKATSAPTPVSDVEDDIVDIEDLDRGQCLRGIKDRVQHIENQVLDDLNKVLDVMNLSNKVLEPDEVLKVLHVDDEVLDIEDEVLDDLNQVFEVRNLVDKVLETDEVPEV